MLGAKHWYFSKTILGAVISLVAVVLKELNINISVEELNDYVLLISQVIGLSLVFYGRIKANKVLR